MKNSLIIPVYMPTRIREKPDIVKNCLTSIAAYTNLDNLEIIIIDNGSINDAFHFLTDLKKKLKLKNCKIYSYQRALGYTVACNCGLQIARGQNLILMNDDSLFLKQPINQWLELLENSLESNNTGISGPFYTKCETTGINFCIGCLIMLKRKMLEEIGLFDTIWSPGFGEEIDLTLRAEAYGWKVSCASADGKTPIGNYNFSSGNFPYYHAGQGSFRYVDNWKENVERNINLLKERINNSFYSLENLKRQKFPQLSDEKEEI